MNNKYIWYLPKGWQISGKNVLAVINKVILCKHTSNDTRTNIYLTITVSVVSNDVLTYVTILLCSHDCFKTFLLDHW